MTSVKIASLKPGPFDTIHIKVIDDREGKLGRSAARNLGVKDVGTDWIFFLDADDLMHPGAFESMEGLCHSHNAVFGNIWEYKDGLCSWRYQIPEIERYEDLIALDPYLTLQMGHFVKADVAKALSFNEDLDCGEDWDYYLRLWKLGGCSKIGDPLMINRRGMHSTGRRSATGAQWTAAVRAMLEDARNGN